MIYTKEKFKLFNNIDLTDTSEDTLIDFCLTTAQAEIEKYIGYSLEAKDYTTKIDGVEGYFMNIGIKPINSITSISIDGNAQTINNFIFRNSFIIQKNKENVFTEGIENVEIVYNAGWTTVPDDIQNVCRQIATLYWAEKNQNLAIVSKTDEFGTRTFYRTKIQEYLEKLNGYKII